MSISIFMFTIASSDSYQPSVTGQSFLESFSNCDRLYMSTLCHTIGNGMCLSCSRESGVILSRDRPIYRFTDIFSDI